MDNAEIQPPDGNAREQAIEVKTAANKECYDEDEYATAVVRQCKSFVPRA